jgi:hypothetical protein
MNLLEVPMEHEHLTLTQRTRDEKTEVCRWTIPYTRASGTEDAIVVVTLACPKDPTFRLAVQDAQRAFERKVNEILEDGGVFACSISLPS